MKLRTQFLTILLLAFGSLSVLLVLGRKRLSEAVADTEHIVDQQFNPLVFGNAPQLQQTYEGLTGLLNTIRDANQARIAQIKSTYLTRSKDEIDLLISEARESLQNMESTLQIVAKALPVSLKSDWENHLNSVNDWIAEERQIIQLTEELAKQISLRANYHERAEQSFLPFRSAIDTLGERADLQLSNLREGANIADIGKAISLILNADRDSYQARMAEQKIALHVETDSQRYQEARNDFEENREQIRRRLAEAQTLLGSSENIGFSVVHDLYSKWEADSSAAVAISDQVLDKLRQREKRIAKANILFAQSQKWLSQAHSQLKSIATDEIAAFEAARSHAQETSDKIRERARSYLLLFNILAILASLSFLILIAFQRRMVRNLIGLSSYLSGINEENLRTAYKTPRQSFIPSLELTQLADNLNAMRERLVTIIEAHKNALANLSRSEDRFSKLFYNSVSPILLADPQSGKIIDANQAAATLYQLDIDKLRASYLSRFDSPKPETAESVTQSIRRLPEAQTLEFASLQQKADHSLFSAQVHAGTVEIERSPHALITINDVSERVEFEQQLLKAKNAAENASRAKDEFLSVMSHELRTPLNPIIGYAQLLKSSPQAGEKEEFLTGIISSANHMLNVVERILQFTQLSHDDALALPQEFTLENLLQPARDYAKLKASTNQVSFHNGNASLQKIVPNTALSGAKLNIVQILLNLLENALKYARGATIKITTGLTPNASHYTLHLIVEDRGPGVPEAFQLSLFSPFTQADSSFTRPHEGLGLGLAICQKLATQAGGQIIYEPNEPTGSRFIATFPVSLKEIEPTPENAPQPKVTAPTHQARILLVEDNPENARYFTYVLDQLGFEVDHASTGPLAIEKAQNQSYHAALIDISLKDMDGLEILDRLNQIPEFKESTRSIAVTAHASSVMKDTCLAHGFHDFLTKPVSPNQLSETLDRHLSNC